MSQGFKLWLSASATLVIVVLAASPAARVAAVEVARENCAPDMALTPNVIERHCLDLSELHEEMNLDIAARDLEIHLGGDRACTLELALRVVDAQAGLTLRITPSRVLLVGETERVLFVGQEALRIALAGSTLEVADASRASRTTVSPVAERVGRVHVASDDADCASLGLVLDRLGE